MLVDLYPVFACFWNFTGVLNLNWENERKTDQIMLVDLYPVFACFWNFTGVLNLNWENERKTDQIMLVDGQFHTYTEQD